MRNRKLKVLALMVLVCGGIWGQTTFDKIRLTSPYDQIRFEVGGENRYWIMSKTASSEDKAFALYSPDDGHWFTTWRAGSGDMILHKGNIGVGTYSPFLNTKNHGIHIAKGWHSSLILGLPNSGYGGIVQTSDAKHRIFIGANLYDDQDNSWKNFQPGKGGVGISLLADEGNWGTKINFYASNQDGLSRRMEINSNGRVAIGENTPLDRLHIQAMNDEGILIGSRSKLGWDGTGAQPGYHIRFAGYRDVSGDVTGARISALRTNLCCGGLAQGTELAFFTSGWAAEKSTGDVNLKEAMRINTNANVAIGKTKADHKLDVAGTIRAEEILVEANGNTADFVFEEDYQLKDLSEVESYILTNKHLPDIPSAAEMEEQGVNLAEMNKLLLQKVEELTLYAIELEKTNKEEELEREKLEQRLIKLEKLLIKSE